MRPSPGKAPELPPVTDDLVRETRTYQFLTPVFGGGVKLPADGSVGTKDIDPITPVRVPSIRGQLRFWWRAVNPRGCKTVEELYQAETEIFGGLQWKDPKDGPNAKGKVRRSALEIHVAKQPGTASALEVFVPGERFHLQQGMDAIAYAAFPLRGSDRDHPLHGTLHDYKKQQFQLEFTYPKHVVTAGEEKREIERDIRSALWAWATFGGLGGRTRRGFGAIADVTDPAVVAGLDEGWREYVTGLDVPWPHLPPHGSKRLATASADDGVSALKNLLGQFKALRQSVGLGRNRGKVRAGRSFWPEPDAIRKLTRRTAPAHSERMTEVDAFPRAAFGMPIIFHFKDKPDPGDTTLQPAGKDVDRFASPLVLRPYRDPSQGKVSAMAVELRSRIPEAELKGFGPVATSVSEADARGMKRPPDARERFPKMFHDPVGAYLDLLEDKS